MLLVNNKQVTVKEIQKVLGIEIPIQKIIAKPLYEINAALLIPDPANGIGAVKCRQGIDFPAYFRARTKSGEDVEIRYCLNRTPDTKTHGQTEKFSPRKVEFEGKSEYMGKDDDKAVYYYLHFYNKQSPFRTSSAFEYEYVDNEARADATIALIELRTKAIMHAGNLEGEDLVIIAKGMRIDGVDGQELRMVKAQLMQYAQEKPAEYLNKAQSQVNHIEGLILDAVDKNIIVLETVFNTKRWKWATGPKADTLIVELPSSINDYRHALITHIQQTPGVVNDFLPALIIARSEMSAKTNIKQELEGIDVLGMLKGEKPEQDQEDDLTDPNERPEIFILPASFEEAKDFLGVHIGKKTPALASQLHKGIVANDITLENIEDYLEGLRA